MFLLSVILGLAATFLALSSRYYRQLRDRYAEGTSAEHASVGPPEHPAQG